MDFVHDQLFDGRKIRVLTVVDTFSRLSPAIEVRQQFRGADVVEVLERVSREIGYPKTIRLGTAGIHQQGARSLGFHARRHGRLQPAWQADRQCLH